MARVLFVAQETGGVGKSTVTRALAEAVEDVSILEVEASHRLTEYGRTEAPNRPGVRYFPMRASRDEIEESGGQAAREELDGVVNALYEVTVPSLVDVGANTASSLVDLLGQHAGPLRDGDVELGLIVVVANDPASLAAASKLLHKAKDWAGATFLVANEMRGPVDESLLKRVATGAIISHLRRFEFEKATLSVLAGTGLRGIRQLDRNDLAKEVTPAKAPRVIRDLTAFRLAAMEAVKPAALWVVGEVGNGEAAKGGSGRSAKRGSSA